MEEDQINSLPALINTPPFRTHTKPAAVCQLYHESVSAYVGGGFLASVTHLSVHKMCVCICLFNLSSPKWHKLVLCSVFVTF